MNTLIFAGSMLFLSTLSLRRATSLRQLQSALCRNFYPRSPCGERLGSYSSVAHNMKISIHALLAESDSQAQYDNAKREDFYPRSPCGERLEHLLII